MSDQPDPFLKRASDTAIGMAMYAPIAVGRLLPYRWRVPLVGWITSRIFAPLAGYNKRVRDNLAYVQPDLPQSEVDRLVLTVPDYAGRTMIELFSEDEFINHVRHSPVGGPGLETLQQARADGRPVIFVTGHFGSFNAARVAMIELGFEMGGFYRPMKNKYFNKRYTRAMHALSQPLFEQGKRGMVQMVKHLRSGGVLAILTDLNTHNGVPLDFFGKPALSSLTTAELALKFDAALVPVWGIRQENGIDFSILVEEPIPPTDPVTMTQEVNDRLEHQIRKRMDQWFWIHRRWKDGIGPMADRGAKQLAELRNKS